MNVNLMYRIALSPRPRVHSEHSAARLGAGQRPVGGAPHLPGGADRPRLCGVRRRRDHRVRRGRRGRQVGPMWTDHFLTFIFRAFGRHFYTKRLTKSTFVEGDSNICYILYILYIYIYIYILLWYIKNRAGFEHS